MKYSAAPAGRKGCALAGQSAKNRHNIGFMAMDAVARRWNSAGAHCLSRAVNPGECR